MIISMLSLSKTFAKCNMLVRTALVVEREKGRRRVAGQKKN
jgi:hypothetical protein